MVQVSLKNIDHMQVELWPILYMQVDVFDFRKMCILIKLYVSEQLFAPIMIILQLHKHSISIWSQNCTFPGRVKKTEKWKFPHAHLIYWSMKFYPKWSFFSERVTNIILLWNIKPLVLLIVVGKYRCGHLFLRWHPFVLTRVLKRYLAFIWDWTVQKWEIC